MNPLGSIGGTSFPPPCSLFSDREGDYSLFGSRRIWDAVAVSSVDLGKERVTRRRSPRDYGYYGVRLWMFLFAAEPEKLKEALATRRFNREFQSGTVRNWTLRGADLKIIEKILVCYKRAISQESAEILDLRESFLKYRDKFRQVLSQDTNGDSWRRLVDEVQREVGLLRKSLNKVVPQSSVECESVARGNARRICLSTSALLLGAKPWRLRYAFRQKRLRVQLENGRQVERILGENELTLVKRLQEFYRNKKKRCRVSKDTAKFGKDLHCYRKSLSAIWKSRSSEFVDDRWVTHTEKRARFLEERLCALFDVSSALHPNSVFDKRKGLSAE